LSNSNLLSSLALACGIQRLKKDKYLALGFSERIKLNATIHLVTKGRVVFIQNKCLKVTKSSLAAREIGLSLSCETCLHMLTLLSGERNAANPLPTAAAAAGG